MLCDNPISLAEKTEPADATAGKAESNNPNIKVFRWFCMLPPYNNCFNNSGVIKN
jgi:hypothetical protein